MSYPDAMALFEQAHTARRWELAECDIKRKHDKRYGKCRYLALCYRGMTVVFVVAGQNIVTIRTSWD